MSDAVKALFEAAEAADNYIEQQLRYIEHKPKCHIATNSMLLAVLKHQAAILAALAIIMKKVDV